MFCVGDDDDDHDEGVECSVIDLSVHGHDNDDEGDGAYLRGRRAPCTWS